MGTTPPLPLSLAAEEVGEWTHRSDSGPFLFVCRLNATNRRPL